jgi:hypothetical protein
MFTNTQNQYFEKGYMTEINLCIPCNPHEKSPHALHKDMKINSKVHMKHKNIQIAKTIKNEKSNTGGVTIPVFKT